MSVVIIGGNERMVRRYEDLCKSYDCRAKVFAKTELERLSLRVYCFNLPAIRCYERLGFLVTEYFEETDSHWNNYAMERKK